MASEDHGARAVPREDHGTALVVDAGRASGMSPRFHNLVITSHRDTEPDRETAPPPDLAA